MEGNDHLLKLPNGIGVRDEGLIIYSECPVPFKFYKHFQKEQTKMKTVTMITLSAALSYANFQDSELEKEFNELLDKIDNDLFEIGYEPSDDTSAALDEVDTRMNEIEEGADDTDDEEEIDVEIDDEEED